MENIPKLTIALVDDDSDNHFLFKDALAHIAYPTNLLVFDSGIQFLEYVSDTRKALPHLLFLDINMPQLNGKQCLKMIRADSRLTDVPVIMLSASSHEQDIEETFHAGANRYFIKPICFEEKITILRRVLKDYFEHRLLQGERVNFILSPDESPRSTVHS